MVDDPTPAELFSVAGQGAVVTGAGRGLGRAIAIGLARAGAHVAVVDIDLDNANMVAEEISRLSDAQSLAIGTDVTDPQQVEACLATVEDAFGSLDILVNNAGVWSHASTFDLSLDDWNRVLAINLTGVFLCSQRAGRTMRDQGSGTIINIASISGQLGFPNRAAYATTKHGVIGLTKSLANEWAPHGIRVNAIGPGGHRTALTAEYLADQDTLDEVVRNIPLGRLGEPEELVGSVIFLASRASSYVLGHTLFADGGWLLE